MKYFSTLLLTLCLLTAAFANNDKDSSAPAPQSIFDLMYSETAIPASLTVNMAQVISNKKSKEETKAIFAFTDAYGASHQIATKVSVRGKFRRRVCDLPPLKLNFKKGDLAANGLKDYDKYKLVTHCLDSKEGQENLLREYTAYKLYNQLTDNSFRVQLLKMEYVDAITHDVTDGYAILIEETDEMADRLNGAVIKDRYGMDQSQLQAQNAQMHALFQYMIGNTDWSMARLHNMKVVATSTQNIAVPYDFDFSGLVNASYARPNVNVKQTSVRQRIFMGMDYSDQTWSNTVDLFKAKQALFLSTIKNSTSLKKAAKRDMVKYINGFYDQLEQGISL
ncbi:MAG: hypothetical protein AAF798_21215 [Bacteroidota bacterium]